MISHRWFLALFLFPHVHGSEQPSSPTLSEPWRHISWGDKESDLQYVQNYTPINKRVKHLRVLLYGPVGAGKSSFINSVSSTVRGRLTQPAAPSSTTSDQSFTTTYQTHDIRRGTSDSFYQLVFNDIMGLEEGMERGVRAEDVKLAMMGRVEDGYKFNPRSPLSTDDPKYKPSPSPDDQVHVVVCILSANAVEVKVLEKMKVIREAARDLGIPQMAIITHIDEACEDTEKDLRNVYKSKHLKNKMKDFSAVVGIPMNYIFPVKNYSEENDIVDDVDSLILSALRRIIDFGDDFIGNMDFSHHKYHQDGWMDWFQWFDYRIFLTLLLGFVILIWIRMRMRWY
ncbi:interferon-induced protein 44-like [Scomber japonicus]|uniref:interferon-induced protein 44-like n=1 Tax=Scomber japonicus TaxID=13676 RepID=UPI002305A468|nr:interferon-induced protein 44-like [Scomber japonicus]